ncbi:MAG: hypothetical protein H6Q90_4881 [Deltaproteobacteria bacterium]|nr:hypothetical protein [Deltaproteobacteria bacterium]
MTPASHRPAYVGDVEHDLEVIRMWTSSARSAAGQWMHGFAGARSSHRAVDEALSELRRVCVEVEKLEVLELSVCVWEAILVVDHLRESLGAEDQVIVHAASELLRAREHAIDRAIDDLPALIHATCVAA